MKYLNSLKWMVKWAACLMLTTLIIFLTQGFNFQLENVQFENVPLEKPSRTSENVHTFYYGWYGNPDTDGEYLHWNHAILPHWSDTTWDNAGNFPGGEDIGADYYPQLGCYSSNDSSTICKHMEMIKNAGIGVLVLSWWGKGRFEDKSVMKYLDIAENYDLKIAFHIEPFYKSIEEFKEQLEYLESNYLGHSSVFRIDGKPFYYVYDSYKIKLEEWKKLLKVDGEMSIRKTNLDGIFIGLWVEENEEQFFLESGFDGFYTYFASEGFVYGSTISNWREMAQFAKANKLLFIPCAGPGYLDKKIRPWNVANSKNRAAGKYYERMFHAAVTSKPDFIGITSFNEWHEGSQIEPAVPKKIDGYEYSDYGKDVSPDFYLKQTRQLIDEWIK